MKHRDQKKKIWRVVNVNVNVNVKFSMKHRKLKKKGFVNVNVNACEDVKFPMKHCKRSKKGSSIDAKCTLNFIGIFDPGVQDKYGSYPLGHRIRILFFFK